VERSIKIAFSGREQFARRYVDYDLCGVVCVCVFILDMTVQSMDLGNALVECCGRSTSCVHSQERSALSEHGFGDRQECWLTKYEHILVERNTFKIGICR
jgi:hypothetical protein